MKVALVHDWLNQKAGGAERVLFALTELFPDAPVYTLLYNPARFEEKLPPDHVRQSGLQRWPRPLQERTRYLTPLIPTQIEGWDFSDFDLVISSSGAWSKNILTPPHTTHICYCHSPMRFAWDYWPRYLDEQHVGGLRSFYIRRLTSRLRVWDRIGVQRVDYFIANSRTTAQRIAKYYGRESEVIYPPVNSEKFAPSKQKSDYFLIVGALTPYKKIDVAIEACNEKKRRLIIVGSGADQSRLEKLAGPTIEFRGFVPDSDLPKLYAEAQATLYPQEEDFGITAVESLASGTPVIAYHRGGATETISESKTGIFFDEQSPQSLAAAFDKFERSTFDVSAMTAAAQSFSQKQFSQKMKDFVQAHV